MEKATPRVIMKRIFGAFTVLFPIFWICLISYLIYKKPPDLPLSEGLAYIPGIWTYTFVLFHLAVFPCVAIPYLLCIVCGAAIWRNPQSRLGLCAVALFSLLIFSAGALMGGCSMRGAPPGVTVIL